MVGFYVGRDQNFFSSPENYGDWRSARSRSSVLSGNYRGDRGPGCGALSRRRRRGSRREDPRHRQRDPRVDFTSGARLAALRVFGRTRRVALLLESGVFFVADEVRQPFHGTPGALLAELEGLEEGKTPARLDG